MPSLVYSPYMVNTRMLIRHLIEASIFDERTLLRTKWTSPKQLMAWLRANGFQKKGSGSFGAVFIRPGYNRVIKLSTKEDVCWMRFAEWALSVTNNPHLPDIKWMQQYTGSKGQKFFLALVEKLAPFNRHAIMNTTDLIGLAYLYVHEDWFQGQGIFHRLVKEGIVDEDDLAEDVAISRWLKKSKGSRKFIATLRTAENRATGVCSYDMHPGNIMYRPSDQKLVVIDPLADLTNL